MPALPASIPLLLRIEPDSSDFDYLRSAFKFEVVSEQEDGVVIIASDDTDLNLFLEKVEGFVHKRHGTGVAAKVYDILDASQPDLRLDKLLSEPLRRKWHLIDDQTTYTVDVGVYCLGAVAPPDPPEREDGEDDEHFQQRMARWRVKYNQAQDEWGVLQTERAWQLESFVRGYEGSVLSITEEEGEPDVAFARLPDSFTVRIRIRDIGLKDLVMNHPHVFEVGEPDEMLLAPVGQARNDGQSLNSRMTARQPFA